MWVLPGKRILSKKNSIDLFFLKCLCHFVPEGMQAQLKIHFQIPIKLSLCNGVLSQLVRSCRAEGKIISYGPSKN